MKKQLHFFLFLLTLAINRVSSQCINAVVAAADVTLQTGGGGNTNRTAVVYNPLLNIYYAADAGNSSYPLETYSVAGAGGTGFGPLVLSTTQGADYRGYWWNPIIGKPEGNTFGSGGVYSNSLNASGYAVAPVTLMNGATMPNSQSCGSADFVKNIIYYYDAGTIYRYNKSTNTLISSNAISGLPAPTSNLNSYAVAFTGLPGSELAVYDYINKAVYFLNATNAAYSASCALPSSAPAASSFKMGWANNRLFLFDGVSLGNWYGYPVLNTSLQPTLSVTSSTTSICPGTPNPVTITASGASTYSWSNGSTGSSIIVSPTISTVYVFCGANANGCGSTANIYTVGISVTSGPTVSAIVSPSSSCIGSAVTLSASGVSSYTWSAGSSPNSPTTTTGATATTVFTVLGTNSIGCVSAAQATLIVNNSVPALTVSTSTNQACLGGTVTLTASGALSYTWTGGAANGIPFTPTATGSYTVSGQNGCGITTSVTSLTVNPLPLTISSTPSVVCSGQPCTLTATSSGLTYSWFPTTSANNTFVVYPTSTTVYSVAASNGSCRSLTTTITVATNPLPSVSIVPSSTSVCSGNVVTLTATGGNSYTWSTNGTVAPSITVAPTSATLYSVVAINSFSCTSFVSQPIVVVPPPIVNITASDLEVCNGNSSYLSATGTANSYSWSTGSVGNTETVSPTQQTVYYLTGINTSNNCSATSSVVINVFTPPISLSGNTVICDGATSTLQANGATTYSWSNGIQFSVNPVNPNATTVYTLNTIATSSTGLTCPGVFTIQVTVNPTPTLNITSTRSVICRGETTTLTVAGASTYSWSTAETTSAIVVTSSLVGIVNITITGSTTAGCSGTDAYNVKVNSCNGINQYNLANSFNVYPNPSNGELTLEAQEDISLTIINSLGQCIKQVELSQVNGHQLRMFNLASGVYYISIKNGAEFLGAKKVIVQN
jgi:hypothetical protein